jgi:hypothetical protein
MTKSSLCERKHIVAKKVPTRAVPTTLTPEARNFVLQNQHSEPVVVPPNHGSPVVAAPVVERQPVASPTRKKGNRAVISRTDGRTLRRLQVYLDADIAKRLRLHCVEHDIDMSAYLNEVLTRSLR